MPLVVRHWLVIYKDPLASCSLILVQKHRVGNWHFGLLHSCNIESCLIFFWFLLVDLSCLSVALILCWRLRYAVFSYFFEFSSGSEPSFLPILSRAVEVVCLAGAELASAGNPGLERVNGYSSDIASGSKFSILLGSSLFNFIRSFTTDLVHGFLLRKLRGNGIVSILVDPGFWGSSIAIGGVIFSSFPNSFFTWPRMSSRWFMILSDSFANDWSVLLFHISFIQSAMMSWSDNASSVE